MYIACSVRELGIDEFHSFKFDSIKLTLFEHESLGTFEVYCNNLLGRSSINK